MKLILLTYINRSGSTYLANLFSKSPDILVSPEGEAFMNELLVMPDKPFIWNEETRKKFIWYFNEDSKIKGWGLTEEVLDHLPSGVSNFEVFILILSSYRDINKPGANILLFKAERLVHLFDKLMDITSVVEIIYLSIIRDCRGVYASQKATKIPDTNLFMSRDPMKTSINWKKHVEIALHFKKTGKLLIVQYEELILNTRETLSKLVKDMGIALFSVEGNGDLLKRMSESHCKIHRNIDLGPLNNRCFSWKKDLSKNEIFSIQKIAGKQLSILGYNLLHIKGISLAKCIIPQCLYFRYVVGKSFGKLKFLFKRVISYFK